MPAAVGITDVFSSGASGGLNSGGFDVGGGTPIVSDGTPKFLGALDFTTLPSQTFNVDGSYSLATTEGSTVPSLNVVAKNMANNTGGSYAITGGKLLVDIRPVTSIFGTGYWSTSHSSFLAIDMRQFTDILGDVNWQNYELIMDVEHDPIYSAPNALPTNPGNVEIDFGIIPNVSTYLSNATIPSKFYLARLRSDAPNGAAASDGSYYWGSTYKTTSIGQHGLANNAFKTNVVPYNSLYTVGPNRTVTTFSSHGMAITFKTSANLSYRYWTVSGYQNWNGDTYNDWDPAANANTGGFRPIQTNDIWATILGCRTGSTGLATAFKISKISFYVRSRI